MVKLSTYLSSEEAKIEVAHKKLFTLLKEANDITDELSKWMENEKFILGDNFEFGDDFIAEYENVADDAQN